MAQSSDQNRLALVLDPEDDLDSLRALRQLHARPLGQIVCEPDPTCDYHDLAHHLLDALGKTTSDRRGAWKRAQLLLQAEQTRELILLRAHLLTYPALRRLADVAEQTSTRLWLICARERPTGPILQLLERRPHTSDTLPRLIEQLSVTPQLDLEDDDLPQHGGLDYPYLQLLEHPRRTVRDLAYRLRGPDRAAVLDGYHDARQWTTGWLAQRPEATRQDAADAAWRLTAATPTASEAVVRAHAALHAFSDFGWTVRPAALDHLNIDDWGERRPTTYLDELNRAAGLADRCADTGHAGLIALTMLTSCRYVIVRIPAANVTPGATAIYLVARSPWAIPPILRPYLNALRAQALRRGPAIELLSCLAGRGRRPHPNTLRRIYNQHHVPDSLRVYGTGAVDPDQLAGDSLIRDGRSVLDRLTPTRLFADH